MSPTTSVRAPLSLLSLLALLAPAGRAQCQVSPLGTLLSADASGGDAIASSVSLALDTALLGAPGDADSGNGSGSAYVFELTQAGFAQTAKLKAKDGAFGDGFGRSVAVDGDRALIGAPGSDANGTNAGAAYVFQRQGAIWVQTQKIVTGTSFFDVFGSAVALSGDVALVSSPNDAPLGPIDGSVTFLAHNGLGFVQIDKVNAPDGSFGSGFGSAVAIDADLAAIGVPSSKLGSGAGVAVVYARNGAAWLQIAVLVPSSGKPGDRFGDALAVSGELVLVGAPKDGALGADAGAAYVFERQGASFVEVGLLRPSGGASGDGFGASVALDGERALIGAPGDDAGGADAGASYLFVRQGGVWVEAAKIAGLAAGDAFGRAGALAGTTALVGSPSADAAGADSGSARAFRLECAPLVASPPTLSVAQGGAQAFALDATASHALRPYLLLGSFGAATPGFPIDGLVLPLTFDAYTFFTLLQPNTPPLAGSFGVLDTAGRAQASFTLPAGANPAAIGLVLRHAFVVVRVEPIPRVVLASNAVELAITQ